MSDDNNIHEEEISLISLTDEEGNEVKLELIGCIDYQGAEYMVLLPYGEDEEAEEVIILEIEPQPDGTECYLTVEDEAILQAVFDIFRERFGDIFKFED